MNRWTRVGLRLVCLVLALLVLLRGRLDVSESIRLLVVVVALLAIWLIAMALRKPPGVER